MVHGQLVETEHNLQAGGNMATLMTDQLIGTAGGTEETVHVPGQLGQRVAAEVPDGTKVLCRKLVR